MVKIKDIGDKLNNLWVGLAGNRLLFSAGAALTAGLAVLSLGIELDKAKVWQSSPVIFGAEVLNTYAVVMGFFVNCGVGTKEAYKKTREHIRRWGRIDERFFKALLKGDTGGYVGYCQLQGIYLASRESGLTERFSELKKEHTQNRIPNF